MNLIQQLLARFHSLDGTTVPEKWRNYNTFLESLRSPSYTLSDLNDFISSITPKDSLEEAFIIETMIGLNLHKSIMDELKNNNQLLIGKLLKKQKVFADIFSNLNPQTFIEDVFPHLSHVTKLKLLHGISKHVKSETVVDKYFLTVESGYGSKLAANLLAGCSVSLIKTKIEKFYIRLSNRELMSISKRDKDFFLFYLKLYEKKELVYKFTSWSYSKSFRKFSQMYPEMYWRVHDKFKMDVVFGRRATPKMFKHGYTMLTNCDGILHYFKKFDRLYRAAKKSEEWQKFPAGISSATHDEFVHMYFSQNVERFMNQFPPSQRYLIFSEIIPVQWRDSIINTLIADDESLIIFYDPSKSIPLIKKKLQDSEDVYYQNRLMDWLVLTCTINKDRQALMEVLDYVWSSYRNDVNILTHFFSVLMDLPDVAKLSESSWQKITDMNKVVEILRPQYNNSSFYRKLFMHLIENGKPFEEHCRRRLEKIMNTCEYVSTDDIQIFAPRKYKRMYLEEMGKHFLLFKDHKNYQIVCISYLLLLTEFNTSNQGKTNPIDLNTYSKLYHQINTTVYYGSIDIIKYGLKYYGSDEIWHDLFWKIPGNSMDNRTLAKYMQEWPEKFAENLDKVLDYIQPKFLKYFFWQVKRFLGRNSSEKLKQHALNLLRQNRYEDIKSGVSILAIIAPETFLNLARTLIENTVFGGCSQNEFTQKKLMIKQLHRLGNIKDTLSLIQKYCNNVSCIRYALIPLWSIAYRTAENYIKEELIKFTDGPPSVKKTVLILSTILLKPDNFAQVLEVLAHKENNASMKHIIFEKSLEYLKENPSEFIWNSFKARVSSIDYKDVYKSLVEMSKIPREYLPEYIPMVFEKISGNPLREIRMKKFEFLEAIPNEIIDSLDMGFLTRIIKETACLEKVSNFHWKPVFFTGQVKRYELLEANFKAIDEFIQENRPHFYRNGKARNIVTSFVSRFVEVSLIRKQHGDLIEKFIVLWNSIEGSGIFVQNYLTVRFTDAYFKSDFDPYNMGVETKKLLDNYVGEMGLSIIPLFSDQMNTFLSTTRIKYRNEIPKFAEGLLEGSFDEKAYALMVNLLTKNPPKISEQYEYGAVLVPLLMCQDPMVKFHLDGLFEVCWVYECIKE